MEVFGYVEFEDEFFCYTTEKGDDGTDGKSAYEIAVDNGFEGTEEEWLESLQGYTPEKGVDYWTEEDKQEMIEDVIDNMIFTTSDSQYKFNY